MQNDVYERLKDISIFAHLPQPAMVALSEQALVKTYPKNTIVFNEGDDSASFHVILKGSVRVYLSNEDGKEHTLSQDGAGKYFGELALLDEAPRTASVITTEKSTCGIISKTVFKNWLSEHPEAALPIMKGLVQMIRKLTDNVKSLALSDVYGRLRTVLLNLSGETGTGSTIEPKPTQQQLANRIGASREMVSKIFKELVTGGYIAVEKKSLIINKKLPISW